MQKKTHCTMTPNFENVWHKGISYYAKSPIKLRL